MTVLVCTSRSFNCIVSLYDAAKFDISNSHTLFIKTRLMTAISRVLSLLPEIRSDLRLLCHLNDAEAQLCRGCALHKTTNYLHCLRF